MARLSLLLPSCTQSIKLSSVLIENSIWRLVAFIGGFVVPVIIVEFYYLNVWLI